MASDASCQARRARAARKQRSSGARAVRERRPIGSFGRSGGRAEGRPGGREVGRSVWRSVGRAVVRTVRQSVGRPIARSFQSAGRRGGQDRSGGWADGRWVRRWVGRSSGRAVGRSVGGAVSQSGGGSVGRSANRPPTTIASRRRTEEPLPTLSNPSCFFQHTAHLGSFLGVDAFIIQAMLNLKSSSGRGLGNNGDKRQYERPQGCVLASLRRHLLLRHDPRTAAWCIYMSL